jgi:hypothetical protein
MSRRPEEEAMERRGPGRVLGDERGMALVLALLVLLILTVIGAGLMTNVTTETKIAGYKMRDTQALTIAEAGVQEAMLRIRNGDFLDDLNPRRVHLIYDQVPGSIPVSGVDTTSLATLQPAGAYLGYSSPTKNPTVLSIKYKTRGSSIVRYDESATPKINTATGNPIFVIQSTGRTGNAYRTIYAEVTRGKVNVIARSALTAKVPVSFSGNISLCGHDHSVTTPNNTPMGAFSCDLRWAPTVHGSCLPGAWSTGSITDDGSANVTGEPTPKKQNQTGFYSGPWDALAMTQNDFWTWVGAARTSEPASTNGIFHLDDDLVKQNQSGNFAFNGGVGEGFLYVDGDLFLNGTFTYRGLIYVEGDLRINGDCWILGGLIVKGKSQVKIANGSATILYSSDSIAQSISKYGGDIKTVAWREL